MSHDSAPGHRRELLADEAWLRRRYERDGDNAIAAYVGVSATSVRRARVKLGIVSRPRGGSERGTTRTYRVNAHPRRSAAVQIAERIAAESASGVEPVEDVIAARTRGYVEAKNERHLRSMIDHALSAAAAWGLLADHLQTLEAA